MSLDTALAEVVGAAVAPLAEELRAVRTELAALRAASPSQWVSQARAAELLAVSTQTITAMARRGDLVSRRAGRRILIDAASLRPATPERIAELADKARGLR